VKSGYTTYKTVNVDTADQGKLILICYDVAIRSCRQASGNFGRTEMVEERTRHLFKAQDAITELMSSLNMEAGEIAKNLYRLYEYFLHRLVEANVKSEKSCVEEVLRHLENLRDAWCQALAVLKKEQAPAFVASEPAMQANFALTA